MRTLRPIAGAPRPVPLDCAASLQETALSYFGSADFRWPRTLRSDQHPLRTLALAHDLEVRDDPTALITCC